MSSSLTVEIVREILQKSINSTPEQISKFFKTGIDDYAEHDRFMGVKTTKLREIAKKFSALEFDKISVLISSKINEERLLALIILTNNYKSGSVEEKEKIYQFYISKMSHINNWNLVDSSAHIIIGGHTFGKDTKLIEILAKSKNLWERRIAIVSTWYFIRNGDLSLTFKIAKILLNDEHDLIHKAVGWMLRETGKRDQSALIKFLKENVQSMPRTMFRYAIERLSEAQKGYLKITT